MAGPIFYEFKQLMVDSDVILGVGEGEAGETLVWLDEKADPEALASLYVTARSIESGEGVRFIFSAPFRAFVDTKIKHRPSPSGVSIGHYRITAGTQGFIAEDIETKSKVIVSNAHVLWNVNRAKAGEPILQPGPIDGGKNPTDIIARALRSIPLTSSGNTADAAVAVVLDPWEEFVSQEILNLGFPTGATNAFAGQQICGSGRTSADGALPNRGTILAVNATVKVDYGEDGTKTFLDCAISDLFSQPGDSGTAMLDFFTRTVVGLLFAGGGGYTIICQQKYFMDRLGIQIASTPHKLYSGAFDASHWNTPSGAYEVGDGYFKANAEGLTLNFFQNLKDLGFEVGILKLCQPGYGKDPKFDEYYGYCREAGLEVMAYEYFVPSYSANEHFNLWIDSLGGKELYGPPCIDCEEDSGRTPAHITEVLKLTSQLFEGWYKLSKPYLYSNISWWLEHVLPWIVDGVDLWSLHPLWDAWWSKKAIFPEVPYSWKEKKGMPDMWQVGPYKIPGFSGLLDCNIIFPSGQKYRKSAGPQPETVSLTVQITGSGSVSPPSGQYPKNQALQIQATPSEAWKFDSWIGDVTSQENPLTLMMDSDKSITAIFIHSSGSKPAEYSLIYNKGITQVDGQNVRSEPSTRGGSKTVIGGLRKGQTVHIFDKVTEAPGKDWVLIAFDEYSGKKYWAAQFHNGTEYIKYVMVDVED